MPTLAELRKDHILLAAHRGVAGGNIPCNTLTAYQIALDQGADIVETDVAVSNDGQLFTFHPHMEKAHLLFPTLIADMPAADTANLRYANFDNVPTQFGVQTFDETLELLKGKCFLNIDKFWTDIPRISDCIRRHGMADQVLIKTPAKPEYLDLVEKYAPDMPFMTVISREDTISESLLKRNINYVGAEVLFSSEDAPVCQPEYLRTMHESGLLVWCNSIIYDHRAQLTAGHSDDLAMSGKMDEAWGWLADRGFDIIQTDWLLPLRMYFQKRGLKVR